MSGAERMSHGRMPQNDHGYPLIIGNVTQGAEVSNVWDL
jgi:hypothetical protein